MSEQDEYEISRMVEAVERTADREIRAAEKENERLLRRVSELELSVSVRLKEIQHGEGRERGYRDEIRRLHETLRELKAVAEEEMPEGEEEMQIGAGLDPLWLAQRCDAALGEG